MSFPVLIFLTVAVLGTSRMDKFLGSLFGAQFPNSAFAETGPRVQCAAEFPHWEFSSILALCRLQGAGPDLLPMVVLAGSRVRRPWTI